MTDQHPLDDPTAGTTGYAGVERRRAAHLELRAESGRGLAEMGSLAAALNRAAAAADTIARAAQAPADERTAKALAVLDALDFISKTGDLKVFTDYALNSEPITLAKIGRLDSVCVGQHDYAAAIIAAASEALR